MFIGLIQRLQTGEIDDIYKLILRSKKIILKKPIVSFTTFFKKLHGGTREHDIKKVPYICLFLLTTQDPVLIGIKMCIAV